MNAIAIIISLIALVGAGFAFLRASSSHRIMTKRVEKQKDRITILEERLRRLEGGTGRSRRGADEPQDESRKNQPRQERHERQEQRHEERQKQRSKKSKSERQPQDRPQLEEQPQERQQERRQREKQSPDMSQQAQHREPVERPEQQTQQQEEGQQRRPRRDNRRRNEPRDASHNPEEGQERGSAPVNLEIAGASLLDELEQEAASANTPPVETSASVAPSPAESPAHPGKAYAIIPEDGLIRPHQLQQQPDSDSYIEVDVPKDGGNQTYYRFNLAGNHAFVISQGIDRLENAFAFEKPSNRMVSRVVQQHDGVLARVGNGWKIEQKARIDFR